MIKDTSRKKKVHRATDFQQNDGNRVVVVGTGSVGASAAFALMVEGAASEIVLIDANKDKCEGEALDLEHGLSFVSEVKIWAGTYEDCKEARVVVICAGLAQKPGQTRLDLASENAKIVADVAKNVRKFTDRAVLLVVTNPLDIMTYVAMKASGLPSSQVFGTGTTLDSSRFRHLLAEEFDLATESVGAYLIGEHGDSQVPVYSHCNVMGEPLASLPQYTQEKVEKAYLATKNAAANVIAKKGYTSYAIALAVARVVRAILYDENHAFPVSVYLSGEYGLKDIYISIPAIVGSTGIKRILDINLSLDERKKLHDSASTIRETIESIEAAS
ncbi:MAG: L-lactate dehydrogenase [Patescibacteria group bacterium]|jgi:L-lactate dehydrogenase